MAQIAKAGGTVFASRIGAPIRQHQQLSRQDLHGERDLVYRRNLTLNRQRDYVQFRSLYVNGNLTLSGASTKTNCTALYARDTFTISGPSGVDLFGPIYVGGLPPGAGEHRHPPLGEEHQLHGP